MTKIVIIGGVAGGASAAARARRLSEDAEIIMFERGPYVSFANCGLPYHIGGDIKERSNLLLQTPESFLARFNVDVRTMNEVLRINRAAKTITVRICSINLSMMKTMIFCCSLPVQVQSSRRFLGFKTH